MSDEVNVKTSNIDVLPMCGKCLHPKGKGVRGHFCNQTSLLQNIENILSTHVQERIASKIMKEKLTESDDTENRDIYNKKKLLS